MLLVSNNVTKKPVFLKLTGFGKLKISPLTRSDIRKLAKYIEVNTGKRKKLVRKLIVLFGSEITDTEVKVNKARVKKISDKGLKKIAKKLVKKWRFLIDHEYKPKESALKSLSKLILEINKKVNLRKPTITPNLLSEPGDLAINELLRQDQNRARELFESSQTAGEQLLKQVDVDLNKIHLNELDRYAELAKSDLENIAQQVLGQQDERAMILGNQLGHANIEVQTALATSNITDTFLEAQQGVEAMYDSLGFNNFEITSELERINALAEQSLLNQSAMAQNILGDALITNHRDLLGLSSIVHENALSISSLLGAPDIDLTRQLLGEVSIDAIERTVGDFEKWFKASDALAELARVIETVPENEREQWFGEESDESFNDETIEDSSVVDKEVDNTASAIQPDKITEDANKSIEEIKKGNRPSLNIFDSEFKKASYWAAIIIPILYARACGREVTVIDNSTTINNVENIINCPINEEHHSQTIYSMGKVRTENANGMLNLREEPSQNSEKKGQVSNRKLVAITEIRGQWAMIKTEVDGDLAAGWASLEYIQFLGSKPQDSES